MERMSAAEFRKKHNITGGFVDGRNNFKGTREASSLYSDDSEREIYRQAIQALRDLQGCHQTELYSEPLRITVDHYGPTSADYDNILKAAADSLQGYAFKNDKQVRGTGKGQLHDN